MKTRIISGLTLCYLACLTGWAQGEDFQIQLTSGVVDYDYQENDDSSFTSGGVLNSEKGVMPMTKISLLQQTSVLDQTADKGWAPYGRLDFQYARGDTDYDGYLNKGSQFTPYKATTNNRIWQADIALGMQKSLTDNLSITPNVNISHRRWKRELQQYREDFKHTAVSAGLNVDWQPIENKPFVIAATGQIGRTVKTEVDVPESGFKQSIGNAKIWKLGIEGQYYFKENLSINSGVSHSKWKYKESAVENGYQYSDSKSSETQWHLGWGYNF